MTQQRHLRGTGTYWGGLDGIRALAVVLVFLTHLPMRSWRGGYVGVDVFFCLSGFLITSLLFADADRSGHIGIRRFYARRLVRLYPAMLLGLLLAGMLVVVSSRYHLRSFLWDALTSLTYTYNFRSILDHQPSAIGQFWSLSVEEQFYLLWAPIVVLAHRRFGLGQRLLRIALGCLVTMVVLKAVVLLQLPPKAPNYAYFLLPGHADELLLGAILALLVRVGRTTLRSPWLAGAAGLALLTMAWKLTDRPTYAVATIGWLGAAALGGVLVLHVTTAPDSPVTRLLSLAPLRWLGARSYAFYLFHIAVLRALLEVFGRRPLLIGSAGFAICLVLVGLSWRYVEEPALRWRDRRTSGLAVEVGSPVAEPAAAAQPLV